VAKFLATAEYCSCFQGKFVFDFCVKTPRMFCSACMSPQQPETPPSCSLALKIRGMECTTALRSHGFELSQLMHHQQIYIHAFYA
jgi:hypothetical protein